MPAHPDSNPKVCCFCRLPKADRSCPLCQGPVCRTCMIRPPGDAFALEQKRAPELSHTEYCPSCFDSRIAPEIERYEQLLKAGEEVYFWSRTYRGRLPLVRKSTTRIEVSKLRDRDEVLLWLGFRAAEGGFNALIEVEVRSRKVRENNYQKMEWSGHGLPAEVDVDRLSQDTERFNT